MPAYRSRTTTHGRNMAGARALWRATGMKDGDFDKPIIAVANSFTQFVPGHVHLKDLGQLVAREIEAAGGVAKEFNTIAVDDGIAMGHGGMLYSLPSRELIADAVEYMCNAHCADALVCISNCDKITPGMLMAALRLNIPAVFVSGGPMEAGKVTWNAQTIKLDLVDAMVQAADANCSDEEVAAVERSACPTCGSCSGMFTANSMNCLTEALGLSLPGNGSLLATHADRKQLFLNAGRRIVELARRWYEHEDASVLPRSIARFEAFASEETRARIPDPQARATFEASRLDWDERTRPPHAGVLRLYRTLLHLRRSEPALTSRQGFRVDEIGRSVEDRPLRHVRWGDGRIPVLLWSQMHGDEPTHTTMLLNLLKLLLEPNTPGERLLRDQPPQPLAPIDQPEVPQVRRAEEPVAPERPQQRLVALQLRQVGQDGLEGHHVLLVLLRPFDPSPDALLQVRDQVADVAAEDLVPPLPPQDHLDVLLGEA